MSIFVGVIGNSRKASTDIINSIKKEVVNGGMDSVGPYPIGDINISDYTYHGYELEIYPSGQNLDFLKQETPEYAHLEVSTDSDGLEMEDLLIGFATKGNSIYSEQISSEIEEFESNKKIDLETHSGDRLDQYSVTRNEPDQDPRPNEQAGEVDSEPSLDQLRKRAVDDSVEQPSSGSVVRSSSTTEYTRSAAVREYVKARAGEHCEGCDKPVPFISKTGNPYFHAHHIDELSDGGADTPQSVIALCPNCHYQVHHGQDGKSYNEDLRKKLSKIEP